MSGVSIKVAGALFSKYVASLTQPDPSGLKGEYFFGKSNSASIVNHVNSALPMSVVGTPTHADLYTTVSAGGTYGSHGFDVGMPPPAADLTLVALVRKRTGFPAFLATAAQYTGFLNLSSVPAFYNSQSGTLTSVADAAVPSSTDFVLMAATGALGQAGKLYVYQSGTAAVATAETANASARPATDLFIGTTMTNGGTGQIDIAYAAVFDAIKSGSQLDAMYASIKSYYADRGLVVS